VSGNPMNGCVFAKACQCSATSKRTGHRCRAPAVNGWSVCRFHGARGGAPRGPSHGNFKHGERSLQAKDQQKELSALLTIRAAGIAAMQG
jgi:hypothetical protein